MANLVNNLPLELANWISLGLFVLLFFFVWLLPFSRVRAPSGKRSATSGSGHQPSLLANWLFMRSLVKEEESRIFL